MGRMTREVKDSRSDVKLHRVTNFMGGNSYEINPIDTLRMVTASSIFGEPAYYRAGEFVKSGIERIQDAIYSVDSLVRPYSVLEDKYAGMKTSDLMEKIIDDALAYDFEATVRWAAILRTEFFMRLNPQVIMVRASMHPNRIEFTKNNPRLFSEINNVVMSRADEPASQLTYWLYKNKDKKKIPSILKRSWAKRIENMKRYEIYKYRNTGIGLIDTIRVCHAHSPLVDELMQTGTVEVKEDTTWENLRSQGKKWIEIVNTIRIPHMALLRNLRGIFEEVEDLELAKQLMAQLKEGVLTGKQFPFRYYTAMGAVKASKVHHKGLILDTLEECMDIARANMPTLKGKTMCLSDNSGSAWGTFNSEYGSVTVAEINNLSSVITAQNSEEGYVGKFGDKLIVTPASKRNGTLAQAQAITAKQYEDVGGATENGIWLFFDQAIKEKEHWDNIFIYSDQQAGHGGLYGIHPEQYAEYCLPRSHCIDVMKMIDKYRSTVNPNVNVFTVQTAGYNDVVVPEYAYRTNVLYGWTGKELIFADAMIKFWDSKKQA